MSVKLEGFKEFERLLKRVPEKVGSKVARGALNKAGTVILKSIRSEVDTRTIIGPRGLVLDGKVLKKSLAKQVRSGSSKLDKYLVIGPQVGGKNDGFFAYWWEFGTLAKRTKPLKGKRSEAAQRLAERGLGIPKMPFLRPGFGKSVKTANEVLGTELNIRLVKEINKLRRK